MFRLRRRGVVSFLACLLVVTIWLVLLSLEQLDRRGTSSNSGINTATEGAELHRSLGLNSSAFLQTLAAPRRPLLVRFDWYSRKITPVHIGYVADTGVYNTV